MRTIRFSHKYSKMPIDFGVSKLLEVFVTDAGYLHEEFKDYDTSYGDRENYPLPTGKVIVMLLRTSVDNVLWTTIRRHTSSKYDYYKGLRGSYVKCVVIEK